MNKERKEQVLKAYYHDKSIRYTTEELLTALKETYKAMWEKVNNGGLI